MKLGNNNDTGRELPESTQRILDMLAMADSLSPQSGELKSAIAKKTAEELAKKAGVPPKDHVKAPWY